MLLTKKYSGPLRKNLQSGFTLMELLIAIVIMGLLLAIAIPAYRNLVSGARKKTARQQVRLLQSAIGFFEVDLGKVPERLTDLVKRPVPGDYYDQDSINDWADGGYIKGGKVPKDPWGRKFVYKLTPGGQNPYQLYSYGPKGKGSSKSEWIK